MLRKEKPATIPIGGVEREKSAACNAAMQSSQGGKGKQESQSLSNTPKRLTLQGQKIPFLFGPDFYEFCPLVSSWN